MFNDKFREQQQTVSIENVRYVDLMNIIQYIYTGRVILQRHQVVGFFEGSEYFQIKLTNTYMQLYTPGENLNNDFVTFKIVRLLIVSFRTYY